jgi:hypothetical protein
MENDPKPEAPKIGATLLVTIQAWVPVLTLVGGALWGLYTYIDHEQKAATLRLAQEEKEGRLRAFEAAKPFFNKMLAGFTESARLIGILRTIDISDPQWNDTEQKFLLLARGEMRLFIVTEVKSKLERTEASLAKYKQIRNEQSRRDFIEDAHQLLHEMATVLFDTYEAQGFGAK